MAQYVAIRNSKLLNKSFQNLTHLIIRQENQSLKITCCGEIGRRSKIAKQAFNQSKLSFRISQKSEKLANLGEVHFCNLSIHIG